MGTKLIESDEYTLHRFYGGDKRGVMYQITQKHTEPFSDSEYHYIHLSAEQIHHIYETIINREYDLIDEEMKVKTLKDLIKENDDDLTFGGYTEDVLQEAAREWIEKIDDVLYDDKKEENLAPYKPDNYYHMDEVMRWIKHFFNLEEDQE